MATETVKTSRNFDLVLDGQLWGVKCHILENFLCGVFITYKPIRNIYTLNIPDWLFSVLDGS